MAAGPEDRIDRPRGRRGLLTRSIPVRLVDLSLSGCLLRTRDAVPVGCMGELRIDVDGRRYRDTVYVTRAVDRQGASRDRDLGAEFPWSQGWGRPRDRSPRSIVPRS